MMVVVGSGSDGVCRVVLLGFGVEWVLGFWIKMGLIINRSLRI